jgi:succinate dehydrogenase / fumarate reductase, cytochrome b subunit
MNMSEVTTKPARRFTNIHITQLMHYRLPLAGVVSILHRVSGALMFLLLPFVLYLFEKSITSEISFNYLQGYVRHWSVKLAILALSWAYLHHLCGGIRHLIMDAHIGLIERRRAQICSYRFCCQLAFNCISRTQIVWSVNMTIERIGPKRLVVGAHYGLKDWLAQRVTAVVMALFTLVLLVAYLITDEVTL